MFVLKLDIKKAFDSVTQANLGQLIFRRIAVGGGVPWARVSLQPGTLDSDRWGKHPDSAVKWCHRQTPVLFAGLIGDAIGAILGESELQPRPSNTRPRPVPPNRGLGAHFKFFILSAYCLNATESASSRGKPSSLISHHYSDSGKFGRQHGEDWVTKQRTLRQC